MIEGWKSKPAGTALAHWVSDKQTKRALKKQMKSMRDHIVGGKAGLEMTDYIPEQDPEDLLKFFTEQQSKKYVDDIVHSTLKLIEI